MKPIQMDIDVPIGDNLYLRIVDLKYTPGDPGNTSGLPENCYPAESSEVDWDDKDVTIVYKVMKVIKKDGKKHQSFNEYPYPSAKGFADHYLDDILEIADEKFAEGDR